MQEDSSNVRPFPGQTTDALTEVLRQGAQNLPFPVVIITLAVGVTISLSPPTSAADQHPLSAP